MAQVQAAPRRQHRCPSCGGSSVQRDYRQGRERWIPNFVPIRPYYCTGCGRRFYDRAVRLER